VSAAGRERGQARRLFPAERVAEFYARGWWSKDTWDSLLRGHAAAKPDAEALCDAPNRASFGSGEPRRLTWREVDAAVDRLAGALLGAGVQAGDVVGIQLPNVVELAIAYLAAARIGAIASPFPIQYREHELEALGALAGLRVFVTMDHVRGRANAKAIALLRDRGAVPSLDVVLAYGTDLPDGVLALDAADPVTTREQQARLAEYLAGRVIDPADCVSLCWTSGTESVPKGVPRTHGDWIAVSMTTVQAPGLTARDVLLNPFPMVAAGGFGGMFLPWLVTGAKLVQHQPFDLEIFLAQVQDERVTYSVSPPAVLTRLLLEPELMERFDLSSLRCVGSGSTPLTPFLIEGWEARGVSVINFFGSNEGISLTGYPDNIPDPADRGRYFPRPGAGLPTRIRTDQWTRARLVEPETGAEISETGRSGELRLQGPTVFAGYWGHPGEASGGGTAFDADGWYATGDIFQYAGARGEYLLYIDRAKDLISRGGMKISAAEIEGLLQSGPGVAEVAAIGVPDPILGERLCAVVVPRAGADVTLADLVAHLRARQVASFKLPERLVIVEELPRNPSGKVLKRELRARFGAEGATS
jgi:acyl-CoA synthetase (AMP-forming)/AMP-acid ligase II